MTSQTHRDILPKEHIMATQTRRTTRHSARFFRATVKAYMVTACCGLVLLSAASSYAALTANGLHVNALTANGLHVNALTANGEPPPAVQGKSLPFHGLSQKALGKTQP
jgi:hypothetical protein